MTRSLFFALPVVLAQQLYTATFPDLYVSTFDPSGGNAPFLDNAEVISPQDAPIDQSTCINAAYNAEYGVWCLQTIIDGSRNAPVGVKQYLCRGVEPGNIQTYITSHGVITAGLCTNGMCTTADAFPLIPSDRKLSSLTAYDAQAGIETIDACIAQVVSLNNAAGSSKYQAAQIRKYWSGQPDNEWVYECAAITTNSRTFQSYQYADTCGYLTEPEDAPAPQEEEEATDGEPAETEAPARLGKRDFRLNKRAPPPGITCEQIQPYIQDSPDLTANCDTTQFVPLVPSSTRRIRRSRSKALAREVAEQ